MILKGTERYGNRKLREGTKNYSLTTKVATAKRVKLKNLPEALLIYNYD